jgi:membrane protein
MALAGFLRSLRVALWQAVAANDVLDTAKAAAYSGMLMLFPAFLVLTTLLAVVPAGNNLLGELRTASEQFLPADTMSLLQSYFIARRAFSLQVLLSAAGLSAFAAWGVMSTLMAGFRRAYRLPRRRKRYSGWSHWQQRMRALLLVPIALVPLSIASAVIVFGKPIEHWMVDNSEHELRAVVLLFWRMVRWSLALLTSTTVLGAVYHFGTNSKERWRCVVPGAVTGTLLWFPVTLAFGIYVTRLADYSIIYGSLGTAIATLVWLYLTSFSVLLGAQLNGVLYRERRRNAILYRSANIHGAAIAEQALPPEPAAPPPPPSISGPVDILVTDAPDYPGKAPV